MSEGAVELAQRGMQSMDAFFDLLDEYVVFDHREYRLPDRPEVEFGRDAGIEMLRRYWGAFEDYSMAAEKIFDAGTSAVLALFERGRGKASGVPTERRWAQIWTFSRGKIVRVETFPTKEAALEAAGISGSDAAS